MVTKTEKKNALEWMETLEDPETRFSLVKIIGKGDSSVVHEAIDTVDGKTVAIKIQNVTQDTIQEVYNEFQILTKVCNEHLKFPMFYGAYKCMKIMPEQFVWFVMEICEKGCIQDLLHRLKARGGFLKEDIIAYILKEVLMGLKDLHAQSVIHMDVKAKNILVNKNGEIKLCDFGFSKKIDSPMGKVQAVIGSPAWMAPEVILSERLQDSAYDSRADVWSLGITAAELGDCDAPIAHVYAPRAMFQIVQNPPPKLRKPSEWSELYNDFISECLEKNPDHRPWSVELIEHPFITVKEDATSDHEERIRKKLLELLEELGQVPDPEPIPEITIKSEMIKMDWNSEPQPLHRDDLVTLYEVSEDSVIDTLSQRFAKGNIYTFLGDVLLIVNPFHEYPIYGPEVANLYKYRARCDNAPHIYAVGDRAYQDMLHHQEIQNVIFTGETGSGKTTARGHLLWHLTNMAGNNKRMIERILNVSKIIEAFGNASTIFNSNSTRHIQYFELTFTKTGKLSGGLLWAYCLEKWRVTNCKKNQSNFHIFYYLMDTLTGTNQHEKYSLEKGINYDYLPQSPSHSAQRNIEKFQEVKEAFNILDFSPEEQSTIVKILSAILLLGQIHFRGDEDQHAEIENLELVEKIAELLQVDDKKLKWTFTNYCVVNSGEAVRGKNNPEEAKETKDSLARSLYSRLVDWIVNLINTKLLFTRLVFGDPQSMGILDIPGFECFAHDNTLDQFLINMTNEQMQYIYNQRVFIWEMHDYETDDLPQAGYNFQDNRELLDITLSKPLGLLSFLDIQTQSGDGDNCKNFLDQIDNKLETRFVKVADYDFGSFTVFHYSGQVTYDARNFVERNKNFLSPEVIQVLRGSTNLTVVQLFSNPMTKTGNVTIGEDDIKMKKQTRWTSALSSTAANAKPQHQYKRFNTLSRGKYSQTRQMQTVATTMRNSLVELLQKVSQGSSHFVRCFRSNLKAKPFAFDRDLVRYQVRALGIMDSIRARQQGYSRRLKFSEFLRRYKFLAFDFDETVEETKDNCRLLLIRLKLEGWALGNNKVFLKYYNEEFLSRLYETEVHKVVRIQSMMRAFLARKRMNTKYPRLTEIRHQGCNYQDKITSNKQKIDVTIKANGRKCDTATVAPYNDYRSVLTKSVNNSARDTSLLRLSIKPFDHTEEDGTPTEQKSPREIAKTFEAQAKQNCQNLQFGARYKPSSSYSSGIVNNNPQSVSGKSESKKMITKVDAVQRQGVQDTETNYDVPGPYNFKAMLRKSTPGAKEFDPIKTPPPMPLLKGGYLLTANLKGLKKEGVKNHDVTTTGIKPLALPRSDKKSDEIAPGLILIGSVEDL